MNKKVYNLIELCVCEILGFIDNMEGRENATRGSVLRWHFYRVDGLPRGRLTVSRYQLRTLMALIEPSVYWRTMM